MKTCSISEPRVLHDLSINLQKRFQETIGRSFSLWADHLSLDYAFLGVNLLSREGKSQTGLTAWALRARAFARTRSTFSKSGSYVSVTSVSFFFLMFGLFSLLLCWPNERKRKKRFTLTIWKLSSFHFSFKCLFAFSFSFSKQTKENEIQTSKWIKFYKRRK